MIKKTKLVRRSKRLDSLVQLRRKSMHSERMEKHVRFLFRVGLYEYSITAADSIMNNEGISGANSEKLTQIIGTESNIFSLEDSLGRILVTFARKVFERKLSLWGILVHDSVSFCINIISIVINIVINY